MKLREKKELCKAKMKELEIKLIEKDEELQKKYSEMDVDLNTVTKVVGIGIASGLIVGAFGGFLLGKR